MARIRSIKPDYWTSEQVLNLSRDARLFFIGLWNFASDYGCHPNQPKNLRVKIFPADEDITVANVRGYIDELSSNNLVAFFDLEGTEFISILGWSKHQRVDKPRKGDIKPPANLKRRRDKSPNNPDAIDAPSPTRIDGRMDGRRDGSIDPYPPTTSGALAGSGCADAPPARRSTETREQREDREARAERKLLEVNGNRFRVDPNGYVVLVESSGAVNAVHDLADDEMQPENAGDPTTWPIAPDGAAYGQKITELRAEALKAKPPDTPEPIRARVDTDFGGPPSAVSC
jgi:hypothetical protein